MDDVPRTVMDYALSYLTVIAPCYPLLALLTTYRYSIQGMGNSLVPFLACAV